MTHPGPNLDPKPAAKADVMTIREMCAAFDVTPRTLRFYEAKELLSPIRQGTRRLFTRRDRARLTLILRGKRFGFSLEDIRQTLDLYDRDGSDAAQRQRACEIARERLAIMEAQRAELDVAIADLKAELAASAVRGTAASHAAE
jgi:DNA-binding transcriptional MerR regulator